MKTIYLQKRDCICSFRRGACSATVVERRDGFNNLSATDVSMNTRKLLVVTSLHMTSRNFECWGAWECGKRSFSTKCLHFPAEWSVLWFSNGACCSTLFVRLTDAEVLNWKCRTVQLSLMQSTILATGFWKRSAVLYRPSGFCKVHESLL